MLKIWGRNSSTNVQKVMWTIGELGLEYTRFDIGGPFGKNKDPEYLALNPNGLIPTLEDGDLVLWESNAIIRYLARKYGRGSLEPTDLKAWALFNQWLDWQASVLLPAISPAIVGLQRTPRDKRNHAEIAASQLQTTNVIKILDRWLAANKFSAGEQFSGSDIPLGIMAYRYRHLVPDRPQLASFDRWFAALESRPAFREHVRGAPMTWLKQSEL